MTTTKVCDKCGEIIGKGEMPDVRVCLGGSDQTYDLCYKCAPKVQEFITGVHDDMEDESLEAEED